MSLLISLLDRGNSETINGSNQGVVTDTSGRNTQPNQPKFISTTSGINNFSGDGTAATLIFETPLINVGTNYSTSNGKFTAPIVGLYHFCTQIDLTGIVLTLTGMSLYFKQSGVSNKNFSIAKLNPYAVALSGAASFNGSVILPMEINDTLEVVCQVSGGLKVAKAASNCTFSGYLVG